MTQDIQRNMPMEISPRNSRCDTNIEGMVQTPNLLGCNTRCFQDEVLPQDRAQDSVKQNQAGPLNAPASLATQFNSQDVKSMDEAVDPMVGRKNYTRNRMTHKERRIFMEQCVARYRERRTTKLIAYELGARESEVKQALFDFTQKHPDMIAEPKVFLATPNTRMKDIGGKDTGTCCYEVEWQEDGSLICKPLVCPSPSSSK